MAHMLARLVYRMLKYGEQYVDKGMNYYEEKYGITKSVAFRRKRKSLDWLSLSAPPTAA